MFDFGFLDFIQLALLVGACFACYIAGRINGAAGIVTELINDNIVTLERLERWANSKDSE